MTTLTRALLPALPVLLLATLLPACEAGAPLEIADAAAPALDGSAAGGALYRVEPTMFPFYSRTEEPAAVGGFGYHTDEWAAIVFYRDPSCVPDDFNLFDFYDFTPVAVAPGVFVPRVFLCAPTVSGFSLHVEPLGMTPPKQSNLSGSAVPIWFVPWDAPFMNAVATGQLTVPQLLAMPGLRMGTATHFREVLHSTANHPIPKINISSRGVLDDGTHFDFGISWPGLTVDDVRHVDIRFR